MMTLPSWAIAAIIGGVGLLFTVLGFAYARMKNATDAARQDGVVITEIKHLGLKIDLINVNMQSQQIASDKRFREIESKQAEHGERLATHDNAINGLERKADALDKNVRSVM